jgi:23S rRNA pseudouridine1911/1915/1917 synthase
MIPQHLQFEVAAEDSGTRLDKYLAAHLPALSRNQLQRLIQEGQVGIAQGAVTAS